MGVAMRLTDSQEVRERVDRLEIPFDELGLDPYGIRKKELVSCLSLLEFFYRRYFRVRAEGVESIPARGRAMLVGNHSGGWAVDAMMVVASCLLDKEPPRLVQSMADRFMYRMPFVSGLNARTGHFVGLPENAEHLLQHDRLLMVFPEGARGTAKLYWERDSLLDFGTGFMRLALETNTPIIPFGFIGGGEAIPTIMNLYGLGKRLGVPYVPITPYLLPLPRPVPLKVRYGTPICFDGNGTEEDAVILEWVDRVKSEVRRLIDEDRP
jgi:1-acyl-sn-glycerol-3-phosphate acyltransferase